MGWHCSGVGFFFSVGEVGEGRGACGEGEGVEDTSAFEQTQTSNSVSSC